MICLKEKNMQRKKKKQNKRKKIKNAFKYDCKRVFQEMWELWDVP